MGTQGQIMKLLSDKDWLEKVLIASEVFKKDVTKYGSHRQEITDFVEWLYKQYGIVLPDYAKK